MEPRQVRLHLWPETYVVARLRTVPEAAMLAAPRGSPVCVIVGHDEISVIAPEASVVRLGDAMESVSGGWRAITLDVLLRHDTVGVLAAMSEALAGVGVPVMVFSSFDTDHLLVPADRLGRALAALNSVDFERFLH
jgi:uncharacterized protein